MQRHKESRGKTHFVEIFLQKISDFKDRNVFMSGTYLRLSNIYDETFPENSSQIFAVNYFC